jgi:hypothetical protein
VATVVVLAAAWVGLGYAVSARTGPVVTEQRQVSDFTAVDVHGSGTLIITQGPTPSLVVEAKRGVIERLTTTVSGGTLTLDYAERWYTPWRLWKDDRVTYRLTVTDLTKIETHGSIDIQAQQALLADQFELSASGSGDVTLELTVKSLSVHTSGSGDVTLSGTADVFTFASSGSSDLRARQLQSREATIECSGSADVEVSVRQRLNVNISGSGSVAYAGNPEVKSSISGSGGIGRVE